MKRIRVLLTAAVRGLWRHIVLDALLRRAVHWILVRGGFSGTAWNRRAEEEALSLARR